MTTELTAASFDIIDRLCEGKSPKDIRAELGLTASVFESRFESIREAAGLPKEKRAYVACADLVAQNLAKLDKFKQEEAYANATFKASLHQFSF